MVVSETGVEFSLAGADTALTLDDFTYELPPELIAQTPLAVRDQSRLLHLNRESGQVSHLLFDSIVDLLKPGDLVVLNNTRVIPARLIAHRNSGGRIKLLLLRPLPGQDGMWEAMVSPIKRLKPGEKLLILQDCSETDKNGDLRGAEEQGHATEQAGARTDMDGQESHPTLQPSVSAHEITICDIVEGEDGHKRLHVNLGAGASVYSLLLRIGNAPLPPYIRREDEAARAADLERYQTVYATEPGAVAAPTAGLHFSEGLLERLSDKGVQIRSLTLHVGPGTFKPIAEGINSHHIEAERYTIPPETAAAINLARAEKRRVIAVGTTTLRALETAGAAGNILPISDATTRLFVKPGHVFTTVDGLITNFHLSRSSLLVLVSAFAGHDKVMNAYREAIDLRYRFYSYGDAMIIL